MFDLKDVKVWRRCPQEIGRTSRTRDGVRLPAMLFVAALAVSAAACSSSTTPAATKASRSTADRASGSATVLASASSQYGSILVNSRGVTLYRYTEDSAGTSACNGGCDTVWPALTVPAGTTPSAGPGVTGSLGTITRQDGSKQVTFDGSPLYTYSGDTAAGQTSGQGIENLWFVVPASGAASPASPGVTTTAPSGTGTTPSSTSAPSNAGSSKANSTPATSAPAPSPTPTPAPTTAPTTAQTTPPTTSPPTTAPPTTTPTTSQPGGGYGY